MTLPFEWLLLLRMTILYLEYKAMQIIYFVYIGILKDYYGFDSFTMSNVDL